MAEAEPAQALAINRDGAERLDFEARLENIPLIHISTD
jgi:dTDP-4-dehydrorhamnose reductase